MINLTRRTAMAQLFSATAALATAACGGGDSEAPAPQTVGAVPAPAPTPAPTSAPPAQSGACMSAPGPKVGKTGALVTRSHLVSGVARIVDSCTIEIANFNYDGLGLSRVLVYGGLGGNYRSGFPIGPNLRGTVYTGQTLRVTLAAGDLDKLDGISIWCADANANFGDVSFI